MSASSVRSSAPRGRPGSSTPLPKPEVAAAAAALQLPLLGDSARRLHASTSRGPALLASLPGPRRPGLPPSFPGCKPAERAALLYCAAPHRLGRQCCSQWRRKSNGGRWPLPWMCGRATPSRSRHPASVALTLMRRRPRPGLHLGRTDASESPCVVKPPRDPAVVQLRLRLRRPRPRRPAPPRLACCDSTAVAEERERRGLRGRGSTPFPSPSCCGRCC